MVALRADLISAGDFDAMIGFLMWLPRTHNYSQINDVVTWVSGLGVPNVAHPCSGGNKDSVFNLGWGK